MNLRLMRAGLACITTVVAALTMLIASAQTPPQQPPAQQPQEISVRLTGGSMRPAYSRSTTADFGFLGSSRGSERTVASPTTPETRI